MSRPLHILLLCYEYAPIGGGGGVGVRQYAEAWVASGHRVTVLTSGSDDLAIEQIEGGLRLIRFRVIGRRRQATTTFLSMLGYLVSGAAWIVLNRTSLVDVDVISTHFSMPTGPLGGFARRMLAVPNVLTIIGGDIFDPSKTSSPHRHLWTRIANRRIIGSADSVIAISNDIRERAERYYGIRRSIQVIPYLFSPPISDGENPPGTTEATPQTDESGRDEDDVFRLIAVGRLISRKGFDYLLRSLTRLPPRVHLELIGEGPLSESLKDLATELGVAERVTWRGYVVDRAAILRRMRQADCFVLSSLHEGLGLVVQEAMYAGLPIVATDDGGQTDMITDGENGLLVPVGDPEAIAGAVLRLMADSEWRKEMGRNSRDRIAGLEMSVNADEVLQVFHAVIASTSGQPTRR